MPATIAPAQTALDLSNDGTGVFDLLIVVEHEPEGANEFGGEFPGHGHADPSLDSGLSPHRPRPAL